MFGLLKKLFDRHEDPPPRRPSTLSRSGVYDSPAAGRRAPPSSRPATEAATPPAAVPGSVVAARKPNGSTAPGQRIEDGGPGKNVLRLAGLNGDAANESLAIVDDEDDEAAFEDGIDPYNTGKFDRSRNWDKRFR